MPRRVVLLLAAVAAAGLVLLLLPSLPSGGTSRSPEKRTSARGDGAPRSAGPRAAREGDRSAAGMAPAATVDEVPPPARPGMLRVRVVERETRAPVGGAETWLLRETAASLREGAELLAEPLVANPVATDARGWAFLPWGEGPGARRAAATADGFAAGATRIEDSGGIAVVLLARGLSLEGRVVTADGAPVAHLEVEARAVRRAVLAAADDVADLVPVPGAEVARGESDGEGRFVLAGLSAGAYRVRSAAPGWTAAADLPSSTLDPLPGAEGVVAEAGAKDVRLVVGAVARLALHVTDAVTGESLPAPWLSVRARRAGEPAVTFTSYGSARSRAAASPDPSFVVVEVPVSAGSGSAPAEVEVSAPGYVAYRGSLALDAAAALPAPPAADGSDAGWTRVALQPEEAGDRAVLVLDCRRAPSGFDRPATRVLTFCREEDSLRFHRRGRPLGGERWSFDGLPSGAGTAEVWDGLSRSRPIEVTLESGATAQGRVEFPAPTGATFAFYGKDGERVFGADLFVVAPDGAERGLPDRSQAARLAAGGDVVVPLEPGKYRFAMNRRGAGYAAGSFQVRAGEVTRVAARLGPILTDAKPRR